jgi:Zn-dependent protease with chaperone function
MGTIEGIRRHGYRKWYERQLVEGHVYLVTMVLALIVMTSGFELLAGKQTPFDLLFDGLLVVGGALVSWLSWRRYALIMMTAEHVGNQASCPACGRYGFRPEPAPEGAARSTSLVAACRGCGHRWRIDPGR